MHSIVYFKNLLLKICRFKPSENVTFNFIDKTFKMFELKKNLLQKNEILDSKILNDVS